MTRNSNDIILSSEENIGERGSNENLTRYSFIIFSWERRTKWKQEKVGTNGGNVNSTVRTTVGLKGSSRRFGEKQ